MTRKFCVVDAEGDVGRLGLLGCAFYSEQMQAYLTDRLEIIEALKTHAERGFTFVAHNAQYDLPVLFWQLDIPMHAVYYNNVFNRGEWKWNGKRSAAQLWDSLDLSGGLSLAALGRAIGLEKLETPQVLQGIDPDRYKWICEKHSIGECVECYAVRDAEIVYTYLQGYADVLRGWGVTPQRRMAGAAIAVWRSLDTPTPIKIRDGRARYVGRSAYFGGRVECFKVGHFAPLYTADIASMYPSVMLETAFPDPKDMVVVYEPDVSAVNWNAEGAAEVLVSIPYSYVPPLPNAHHGERVFGVGLQRGFWTMLELRYAVSIGATIRRCYRAAYSESVLYPFTNFVGTLWYLRQEYAKHGDPRTQTVKVLLNSCYGRLGLRGNLRCEHITPWENGKQAKDYPGGTPEVLGGKAFIRYPVRQPYDMEWANVLWAAQITAAARVKLHRSLSTCGPSLVYCDTDSVFSLSPIQCGDGSLGTLTDHREWSRAWIVGPKLYRLEDSRGNVVLKAKGVRKDQAEAFLRGEPVAYDVPVKPRGQGRAGLMAGTWTQIRRERHLVPFRRTPTNPTAISQDMGWSDTLPPVLGPSL